MSYIWFLIFCFVVWSVVFYPLLGVLNYILSLITAPISKHTKRGELFVYALLFVFYIYINGFVGAYLYTLIDYAAPTVNFPKWKLILTAYFALFTYSFVLQDVINRVAKKNSGSMMLESVLNRKTNGYFYKSIYFVVLSIMSLRANAFMYVFLTLSFFFGNAINHLYFGWPGKFENLFTLLGF